MEKGKRHITQISKGDLSEIADAANLYGGDGIDVSRNDDGLEIKIDKGQLERWIRVVVDGRHLQ